MKTPKVGDFISIEMEVDDDDDGKDRDSKLMWFSEENSLVSKFDAASIGWAFFANDTNFSVPTLFPRSSKKIELKKRTGFNNSLPWTGPIISANGREVKLIEGRKSSFNSMPILLNFKKDKH
jgi:hypothetical protein